MFNVLAKALPLVNKIAAAHDFEYRTYIGDTVNEFGVVTPSYSEWKWCEGSVQPQDSALMDFEGTEPAHRGILVWACIDFNTADIQEHGDQVRWNGRIFNCDRCTNWYDANGWHTFACSEDKHGGVWQRGGSPAAEGEEG